MFRWLRPEPRSLVGAATDLTELTREGQTSDIWSRVTPAPQDWQREAWGYYDSCGPFGNAVTWKANMLGRCRLRAGKTSVDDDEPTVQDNGPAAELMAEWDAGTQSQIIAGLITYLTVPGEGYLVGETQKDGTNLWMARSMEEVRYRPDQRLGQMSAWEVVDERAGGTIKWRRLNGDAMVGRVWRPHRRWYHIADSVARRARTTMRELELADRAIAARYMSRLASAGLVKIPSEIQFPVREEFQDEPDPFVLEFIENAAQAIKTPGSAAAAVPMPLRGAYEYLDRVEFVDYSTKEDEKAIEKRDAAMRKLAVELEAPPEALLGLGDANHWTGWLIDESGFKIYLAPDMELLCDALTRLYLHPRLEAAQEDTEGQVVWYDASEIIQRPDKSTAAKDVYDRFELSGQALRRETGFDEDDAPDDDELQQIILRKLVTIPQSIDSAYEKLTGEPLAPPVTVRETVQAVPTGAEESAASGKPAGERTPPEMPAPLPPGTKPKPVPPAKQAAAIERREALLRQVELPHAIRFGAGGIQVLHPPDCRDRVVSCPLSTVMFTDQLRVRPGTPGVYALSLTVGGAPQLGHALMDADVAYMLPTLAHPR